MCISDHAGTLADIQTTPQLAIRHTMDNSTNSDIGINQSSSEGKLSSDPSSYRLPELREGNNHEYEDEHWLFATGQHHVPQLIAPFRGQYDHDSDGFSESSSVDFFTVSNVTPDQSDTHENS